MIVFSWLELLNLVECDFLVCGGEARQGDDSNEVEGIRIRKWLLRSGLNKKGFSNNVLMGNDKKKISQFGWVTQ